MGKGSKPRPLSISIDEFSNKFDQINWGKKAEHTVKSELKNEDTVRDGRKRSKQLLHKRLLLALFKGFLVRQRGVPTLF